MSIFERVAGAVAANALARVKIPTKVQRHLPIARALLKGDLEGAANAGIDIIAEKYGLPGLGSRYPGASEGLFLPTALLGGITLRKAREIFDEAVATDYAKKNLFHINISDLSGGSAFNFNLFATDISYAAQTVTGEPVYIGSGSFDNVTGTDRVEMTVTTLDDSGGSVKHWFDGRMAALGKSDGTFGLPIEYLFRVDVMHGFIGENAEGSSAAYVNSYIMRPANMAFELSRRDDNLQELQLTFTQFDTFTSLT